MSRDQRPRREVMIDAAPDPVVSAAAEGAAAVGAPTPVAKPRILLPAVLFLLACVVGAVGVALMRSSAL